MSPAAANQPIRNTLPYLEHAVRDFLIVSTSQRPTCPLLLTRHLEMPHLKTSHQRRYQTTRHRDNPSLITHTYRHPKTAGSKQTMLMAYKNNQTFASLIYNIYAPVLHSCSTHSQNTWVKTDQAAVAFLTCKLSQWVLLVSQRPTCIPLLLSSHLEMPHLKTSH